MEGIKGEFAVFETYTNFTTGLTNLVIGQYDKGIEGLIADLQSASAETSSTDATTLEDLVDLIFSAPVRVLASSRVVVRMNNNSSMALGAGWRTNATTNLGRPLGNIGVSGGRTGVYSTADHPAGSTTTTVVGTLDSRYRIVWRLQGS